MKPFISACLLVLLTAGCASMIPKEVQNLVLRPMTDSVVVASAAAFHQKEGRWPRNISEVGLTKQEIEASNYKIPIDFQNITFAENADGKLIIDFDPSTTHRKIELETPNLDHSQYMGTYVKVDGSTYQSSGTISIDTTTTPMSVNFKDNIKSEERPIGDSPIKTK